jgi:hypothetical protein
MGHTAFDILSKVSADTRTVTLPSRAGRVIMHAMRRWPVLLFVLFGACGPPTVSRVAPGDEGPLVVPCGGVIPIGRPVIASMDGQADRLRASCARGAGPECVFKIDIPVRASLRLGVESDELDAALALSRAADARDELACADDTPTGDTRHARLDATLDAGRYLIVVDSVDAASGFFELFAQLDPLPDLDQICASAMPISAGVPLRGSTRGEPDRLVATCAGGAKGPEVIHKLDLTRKSRVRIHQNSEFDGSLYVRARCEDPSTELICNDDFRDARSSQVTLSLEAGGYYIVTDSYSRQEAGSYGLLVERIDEPAPRTLNEACFEAEGVELREGRHELDTFTANSSTEGSCGGKDSPEVMFSFTLTEPRELAARLEHYELNAVLYVRSRCEDGSSEHACYRAPRLDQPPADAQRDRGELRVTLDPGRYFLVVDGSAAEDMGAASLVVRFGPPVPPL